MAKATIRPTPNVTVYPEVRWHPGVDVQLGVVDGDLGEADPARGVFADLTRDAINQLIAKLRQARDEAYGPDQ